MSLPSQLTVNLPTRVVGGETGREGDAGSGEGSKVSSTRASLLSIATDSLALQSVLDGRKGSEEE